MSQSSPRSSLAARRAVDVRAHPSRPRRSLKPLRRDLEVRLETLQRDYAELHTEVFEAAQVHRRLCSPRLVRRGRFEIASEIFAIRHLPGDFFTVDDTSDGVLLTLGDICGKGLAAGMWTTHLVSLVGWLAAETSNVAAIVEGVNRQICGNKSVVPLASMFLAKVDSETGTVEYCSAGHPPALLLRADGTLELLSEGGLLLGVLRGAKYVVGRFELGVGDVLMIYSDGITESLNFAGEEFGHSRLEAQLRKSQQGPADGVLFSILGAVQDFAGACPLVDDMSLAVVRRAGREH